MRRLRLFTVAFILLSAAVFGAQSAQTVKLKGKVTDATGAVMSATTVKAYQKQQLIKEGLTNDAGTFELDLAPGQYGVEISAPDFTPYRETIQLNPNSPALAITLEVAPVQTIVEVTDDPNTVKVDIETDSLGNTTLTGDQLADLPDNEDDLIEYLRQLAGAKGSVDQTAQFIIDGFAGGRLPPKEQIAQIIIEDNPFGADAAGGGPRIRIITRPGSGSWRMQSFNMRFADSSLNARNASATNKPQNRSRTFSPNLSGPIIPGRVTMNLQASSQNNESEADSILAITPDGTIARGLVNPTTNRQFNPRFNIHLDNTHRLNVNVNYSTNHSTNQGGGYQLAERASRSQRNQFSLQVSQSSTISKMENEVRFQMNRNHNTSTPVTTEGRYAGIYTINVSDAFNGGPAQNRSDTRSHSFQFADQLRGQLNKKIQFNTGFQIDYNSNNNVSQNNYTGTFSYASLHDYCYAYYKAFGLFNGVNCDPTRALIEQDIFSFTNSAGTLVPITGIPTQFSQRNGDPRIQSSLGELSAYFESTIRLAPRFQMQLGARYQVQQHIYDYNNIAPRFQTRFQLTKTTVLNAGAGIIYSDNAFSIGNYENTLRNDGTLRQYQVQLTNPGFSPWDVPDLSGFATGATTTITRLARDFVSPYTLQTRFGVDQRINNRIGFNVNYQFNRGVHQNLTRNVNAPLPECVALITGIRTTSQLAACRPDPLLGNISQYESVGLSRSKNLSFTARLQNLGHQEGFNFGMQASYTLGWNYDLGGNPSNNYNLFADWARSQNDLRHRVQAQMSINYRPWGISMQLRPNWNSGNPYNITTGKDDNGDGNINNDRPAGLARNSGQGPSNYQLSGSITKTFILTHRNQNPQANNLLLSNSFAEPQRGGGGGGGGGFGGGGRGGGGFPGGDGGGDQRGNRGDFGGVGGGNFDPRDFPQGEFNGNRGNRGQNGNRGNRGNRGQQDGLRMQLSVQVNNILNHPNARVQSGVLTSPYFGRIIGSGNRSISISLNFQNLF